jgi:hypothetical protein
MVISASYSCSVPSSSSEVDRLLLDLVAELSGVAVEFSPPRAKSAVDSITAVGTLTNVFTGRSEQVALVGVGSILKKWFGEPLDSTREEVVSSWIYAVETSVLMPLRHGDEGKLCDISRKVLQSIISNFCLLSLISFKSSLVGLNRSCEAASI